MEGSIYVHKVKGNLRKIVLTGATTRGLGLLHYISNKGIVGFINEQTLNNNYELVAEYPNWVEAVKSVEFNQDVVVDTEYATSRDIGKLCWFWDDIREDKICGILSDIHCNPYYHKGTYYDGADYYDHCRRLTREEIKNLT